MFYAGALDRRKELLRAHRKGSARIHLKSPWQRYWTYTEIQTMHVFRVLIVLVAIRTSECCTCPVRHPQSWYCSADFVIKGHVRAAEVTVEEEASTWTSTGAPSSFYDIYNSFNAERTMMYDVYVQKVYKGGDIVLANNKVRIFSRGYSSCQPVNLGTKETYVIMGHEINGELDIGTCDYARRTNTITKRQFQGFKRNYKRTCDQCSVQVCGNYGCGYYDYNHGAIYGECTLEVPYYGWYVYDDAQRCEIDFARCGLNKAGNCAWLGHKDYRRCKAQE